MIYKFWKEIYNLFEEMDLRAQADDQQEFRNKGWFGPQIVVLI